MRFIYEIRDLVPPEKSAQGHWGFEALLDEDFAILARQTRRTKHLEKALQEDGKDIAKRFGLAKFGLVNHPYLFVEDSLLLLSARVPGNACDLSLGEHSMRNYVNGFNEYIKFIKEHKATGGEMNGVEYVPHNVDTCEQAFALASIWIHWANMVNYITQ